MSKKVENSKEMLEHYDFTGGVRGKYVDRLRSTGQIMLIDADVAEVFKTAESVNKALRSLMPGKVLVDQRPIR